MTDRFNNMISPERNAMPNPNIVLLPRETWQGYALDFRYTTSHYYDAEIRQSEDGFDVHFVKRPFAQPIQKSNADSDFPDRLYEAWWEGAQAYGIMEDSKLIACAELWKEEWSNRLRVTELWVKEGYRRQGLGHALMDFAKAQARELGCRALMLETQSCNENAIAFYLAQGLELLGFDRCCYSNRDIENREVRLELGCYI